MRSSTTNGNVVSQYTGSPSFAFRVEIACFNANGTFVPEGIVSLDETLAGGTIADVAAGPDVAAAAARSVAVWVEDEACVCAIAHPAIRRAPNTRVHMDVHLIEMISRFGPVNSDAITRAAGYPA